MTTYQDQPLSRRAIREREAEAARAAAAPGAPEGDAPEQTSSSGAPEAATPEPLTYVTQGRTPLPQYDAPVAPADAASDSSAPAGPSEQSGDADGEGYRYRDFSPEGRRAARLGWPQAATESADLDYRTQGRADVPPAPAPEPEQPVEQAQPEQVQPEQVQPEQTAAALSTAAPVEGGLSRRELRALRDAQDREAGIVPPSDEPAGYGSTPPVASAPPASAPPAFAPPAYAPPAYTTQAPAAPVVESQPEQPTPAATPEWLTAFAPPQPVTSEPAEPQPAAFDDILIGETVDDADDADDVSGPVVVAEQVREVPPPLIEPEAPPADALASFEALFRSDTGVTPAQASTPPVSATPSASPIFPMPLVSTPPASAPPAFAAPPAAYTAPPVVEPQAEQPQAETPAPAAPAAAMPTFAQYSDGLQPPSPFDQATVAPPATTPPPAAPAAPPLNLTFLPTASVPIAAEAAAAEPVAPDAPAPDAQVLDAQEPATGSQPPVAGERPRNHWSRQAELDDEAQPATGSLTRDVGVGSATANALVLSDIPSPDIMATPLTSTGDVLVTGSISLPASLSSTGALPTQLDESDLDHLLDPGDHQVASTDSQPVRAIRAVSTHTSSREIIGTIKPKRSNRALTALIISAAGMAVVVVTLLVVALVSGVLG